MSWTLSLAGTSRPSLIVGGPGCLPVLAEWAGGVHEGRRRLVVVGDARVLDLWGARILTALGDDVLPVLRVPPGEPSKDAAHAFAAWEWLAAQGVRRDDVVVVVGGGVVGDLGGFVAATYLRGVQFWQVPTTLLAQVDSSVGGKVAINLSAGKNLVGAFYQADRVLIDPEVLTTLPDDEYAGGLGEVVKYGLLDEHDLLGYLEDHGAEIRSRDPRVLADIVRRCVALKAEVVQEDELDRGRRAVLNLGHTAGHALETGLGYGALPHGIAVGLGLLVALSVSERVVGTDPGLRLRVGALLEELGLPSVTTLPEERALLRAAGHDKKVTAAGRGFVCLRSPGDPVWGVDVSTEELLRGFEAIRR